MGLSDAAEEAGIVRPTRSSSPKCSASIPALVREPILEPSLRTPRRPKRSSRVCRARGRWSGSTPGAGGRWAYKQWTRAHQQTFLRLCTDAGLRVLLLGGPEEVRAMRNCSP
jgi:hypothetical protein